MTDQTTKDTTMPESKPAVGALVEPPVRPLPPEREAFVQWLRAYAGGGEHWRGKVLMGEHDIALALWMDRQREVDRLRAGLLRCARMAEALKRPCSMDPESAQAWRNAEYQAISSGAHIALGTIRGPEVA